MLKKYLPFIFLFAAALLFFWIKKHQRGPVKRISVNTETILPGMKGASSASEPFNRDFRRIIYSKHARCRMSCRHIDESEVEEILKGGKINSDKIEEDLKGKTYPLEGYSHDKQHIRIVIAPHAEECVVVTVVDLDTEWQCNCN